MASQVDERGPIRHFRFRLTRRRLAVFALALALLALASPVADAQLPGTTGGPDDERREGIHDSNFAVRVTCGHFDAPMHKALNCPFPVSSYRILTEFGFHEFFEQARVGVVGVAWAFYKGGVEIAHGLMWTALTMPWLTWFIEVADRISIKLYQLLGDPGDQTSWWWALFLVVMIVAAWKMIGPRLALKGEAAVAEGAKGLLSGVKFLAWAILWFSLLFAAARWHGPNPFSGAPAGTCDNHHVVRVKGCVSGFTRMTLLPVNLIMELASSLDSLGSQVYRTILVDEGTAAPSGFSSTTAAGELAGMWEPYVTGKHLTTEVSEMLQGGFGLGSELEFILDRFGCPTTPGQLADAENTTWRCIRDVEGEDARFACNWSGPPEGRHECRLKARGELVSQMSIFPGCAYEGANLWNCRNIRPSHSWIECQQVLAATGGPPNPEWHCRVKQGRLTEYAAIKQDIADALARLTSRSIDEARVPTLGELIPCPSPGSGTFVRVSAVNTSARVGQMSYLACRILQPWKKYLLHNMWETLHFGEAANPLAANLIDLNQEGAAEADVYPEAGLNNGESIALLLWATTPGSGADVNTELLHNLQFKEDIVTPLSEGQHSLGVIVFGGAAVTGGILAALAMLGLMIYASMHILVSIALAPLVLALAPFPQMRRPTIRFALSLMRSSILVAGMVTFVYVMAIFQEIMADIAKETPAAVAGLLLVFAQLALLWVPFKLFAWSKHANRRIKARLQQEDAWKQLREGGVRKFGAGIVQEVRAAGQDTFGSKKSATLDGQAKRKGADGKQGPSVSTKTGGAMGDSKTDVRGAKKVFSTMAGEVLSGEDAPFAEGKDPTEPQEVKDTGATPFAEGKDRAEPEPQEVKDTGATPFAEGKDPTEPQEVKDTGATPFAEGKDPTEPQEVKDTGATPFAEGKDRAEPEPQEVKDTGATPFAEGKDRAEPEPQEVKDTGAAPFAKGKDRAEPEPQEVKDTGAAPFAKGKDRAEPEPQDRRTSEEQDALRGAAQFERATVGERAKEVTGQAAAAARRALGKGLARTEIGRSFKEQRDKAMQFAEGTLGDVRDEGITALHKKSASDQKAADYIKSDKVDAQALRGYLSGHHRDTEAEGERNATLNQQKEELGKGHKARQGEYKAGVRRLGERETNLEQRKEERKERRESGYYAEYPEQQAPDLQAMDADSRQREEDKPQRAALEDAMKLAEDQHKEDTERIEEKQKQKIWVKGEAWSESVRGLAARRTLLTPPSQLGKKVLNDLLSNPSVRNRLLGEARRMPKDQKAAAQKLGWARLLQPPPERPPEKA